MPSLAFKLPDSEQTKCYQAVSPYGEIPCAGTGQDGAYTINPLSYADNGDGTVTDNNTGLMWQQQDDGVKYNWYRASGTFDATYNPESTDVCGSLDLGGATDWRLPSKKDLMSIVDYAIPAPGPTIRTAYFPNTKATDYWSSTTLAENPIQKWLVSFDDGYLWFNFNSTGRLYVRCVRGGQTESPTILNDNGNGTVTDSRTGLIWQQGEPGKQTWGSALDYCDRLDLGGSTDWRLPNIKELESLIDDTRCYPAIDISKFPDAIASIYWSSTTETGKSGSAFIVDFSCGNVNEGDKNNSFGILDVRCVRSGTLDISPAGSKFGADPGAESVPRIFTVTNEVTSNLTITSSTLTGTNPDNFRLQNDLCTGVTLSPAGTCTLEVVFVPLDPSGKKAVLTVAAGVEQAASANLAGGPDFTAPTGSIRIKNGADATNTTDVTLNLSATDPGGSGLDSMRLANGGGTWSAWEPYAATNPWALTDGAGTKAVYAQFRDKAGNMSDSDPATAGYQAYRDTIIYDPTAPTGTILINNGATATNTTAVTLNLTVTDTGGSGRTWLFMRFKNGGSTFSAWEPYKATKAWTLSEGAGDGVRVVYVRFRDKAGNLSEPYRDTIILDSTAPTGTIAINNGAATTTTTSVTLNLTAGDTGGSGRESMRFRNGGVTTWSTWETYKPTKAWTLSSGAGVKTVFVQFKDKAGNISDADTVATGLQGYKDAILYTGP